MYFSILNEAKETLKSLLIEVYFGTTTLGFNQNVTNKNSKKI